MPPYHSMLPFPSMRPESIRPNIWQVAPPVPEHLKQQFSHINPIVLQVLYNRGIIEPAHVQAFLEKYVLESTDPFLLTDMDKAVARIQHALEQEEQIVIYGDFDADGVTSTVLLTQALRGLGMMTRQVRPYIPDRVDEGYGLNKNALTKIKEQFEADLVISVDCGIRSAAEAAHANDIGLDMIITDHHSLGPELPPATAVINPKRADSQYPETMLAGVGVAYKLTQALCQTMPKRVTFELTDLLDLVAIGTVADLVPLLGENRQLVAKGLTILNETRRPGIRALAKVARLKPGCISSESIAFGLAPRINAAGRLAHAYDAARLLAVNNSLQAAQFAARLDQLNRERQRITADLGAKAEAMVTPDTAILIAADSAFVSGVVGLVASRLADTHYRPAIVIEKGEKESRGSCRSIPEFHITEALDTVAELLVRHGGHAQAAGFTVANENLDEFIIRMTDIAAEKLAGLELHPTLTIDAEIKLTDVDWALFESLTPLEPTGYANPMPVFMSRNVEVCSHRVVGENGTHLQMFVSGGKQASHYQEIAAIAFRQGAWASQLPQYIDIVYTINVNEWRGRRTLQLMIQDIQPAEMKTAVP